MLIKMTLPFFVDVLRAMQDGNHLIPCIADLRNYSRHGIRGLAWSYFFSGKDSFVSRSTVCEQIAMFNLERTSIPVPKILAYELHQSHILRAHLLLEKVQQPIYLCSIPRRRNAGRRRPSGHHLRRPPRRGAALLVMLAAHFMLDASRLFFPAIGSIVLHQDMLFITMYKTDCHWGGRVATVAYRVSTFVSQCSHRKKSLPFKFHFSMQSTRPTASWKSCLVNYETVRSTTEFTVIPRARCHARTRI